MLNGRHHRIALALARTLIPGTERLPAPDAALIARAEMMLHETAPSLVPAWRWLHDAIDVASVAQTGRRFHALDDARRTRVVERWQASGGGRVPLSLVALLYKLLHFDTPEMHAAMGGRLRPERRVVDRPRWLDQIHRASTWSDGDIECDVVVVGTGAGGAFVGRELAKRGYAVVFIEKGEHLRRDAFDGSSVEAYRRFLRSSFAIGNAIIPIFSGELVGGSTAVNGGTCFHTPPWILDDWCEKLGTSDLSPENMADYFARVENVLDVAPSLQREVGPIRDVVARGCDALGWHHFPIRRNARGCTGTGFCHFGCPSDARRSTNLSAIPNALESGAMLLTEAIVDEITLSGNRATGVSVVAKSGQRIRVRAEAVVLAAGTLATPLLLLDQGICNTSGQVGRNLSIHPSVGVLGLMEEEINGHHFTPQGYGCDEFLRDGELILTAQPDTNVAASLFPLTGKPLMNVLESLPHLAGLGLLIRDHSANGRVWRDVGGRPLITYHVTPEDRALLQAGMVHCMEMLLAAGATRFYPTLASMPIVLPHQIGEFRAMLPRAADYSFVSYHPLGTCRMGKDPRNSVVGLDHQTHDVRRLYIADGSTVPGPLGVNPQLTIMSMAVRAADRIHDALGRATMTTARDERLVS
ncbi:MAG: GMC family oxidoreductase N-terminal domain-containing protein [Polyangiaceae bacterium]|nr:GMC family oxidoreductase N-terminal domain-containing protein [Polyangiaceae bacterium]